MAYASFKRERDHDAISGFRKKKHRGRVMDAIRADTTGPRDKLPRGRKVED